jgi:hypothetical protein
MERSLKARILDLNRGSNPFLYEVKGDEVIGRWNWMDATFFKPSGVSKEVQEYEFHVSIDTDKRKWHEKDFTGKSSVDVNLKNGKVSFGTDTFSGNTTSKQMVIGLGKNNATKETGVIGFKLDTSLIKAPIRQLLKDMGYKKALF